MSYSKFTILELKRKFGLKEHKTKLFSDIMAIEPSS